MAKSEGRKRRIYVVLWLLCILGSWLLVPYVLHMGIVPAEVSAAKLLGLLTLQSALLFGILCWLSSLIVPRTDLSPFKTESPVKRIVLPGVICGVVVGLIIHFFDATLFQNSALSGLHPPFLIGFCASFFGGINEEVMLRLFFFTFVYFLFGKIFRFTSQNRLGFLWTTNVIVALVFGLGHLPAAFSLAEPSSLEINRVLFLNGIPGIVFGWLYWSRGLWTAMAAHFVTDLMVHALRF